MRAIQFFFAVKWIARTSRAYLTLCGARPNDNEYFNSKDESRTYCTVKCITVLEAKVSPAFSSVEGKLG